MGGIFIWSYISMWVELCFDQCEVINKTSIELKLKLEKIGCVLFNYIVYRSIFYYTFLQ